MFQHILRGALVSAFLVSVSVHAQDLRGGTFKSLQGTVVVQSEKEHRVAKPGEALMPGQRISTGPGDAASLVLRDGTALVIGPGSSVALTQFEYDPVTHAGGMLLDVYNGSMRMISGWMGKARPEVVKVRTPYAMTGIRGTDFIVEAN